MTEDCDQPIAVTECDQLTPGDVFPYHGVQVQVCSGPIPWVDPFGRTVSQLWCKRLDTGQEGSMSFGKGGVFVDYGDEQ